MAWSRDTLDALWLAASLWDDPDALGVRRRLPRAVAEALLRRGTTLRAMSPGEKARTLGSFTRAIHAELPDAPALPARGLAILAPLVPRHQASAWRRDSGRPRLGFTVDSTTRKALRRLALTLASGSHDR